MTIGGEAVRDKLKKQIHEAAEFAARVVEQPQPTLGIDLDGCVDESSFFNILTHSWPGDVIVITFRRDREKAIADLKKHGIRYTDVVLVSSFDAKAEVIRERGVSFFSRFESNVDKTRLREWLPVVVMLVFVPVDAVVAGATAYWFPQHALWLLLSVVVFGGLGIYFGDWPPVE